jgi:hypothetical protein
MFVVFLRQERTLVMIEPPGQTGRRRVFEVDDRVLIPVEQGRIEPLLSRMRHARVSELGVRVEVTAKKPAEERSRSGAIETMVVIKDSNFHQVLFDSGKTIQLNTLLICRSDIRRTRAHRIPHRSAGTLPFHCASSN